MNPLLFPSPSSGESFQSLAGPPPASPTQRLLSGGQYTSWCTHQNRLAGTFFGPEARRVAQGRCCGRATVTKFVFAAHTTASGGNVSLCFLMHSHTIIPNKDRNRSKLQTNQHHAKKLQAQSLALCCEKGPNFPRLLLWSPPELCF